MTGYNVAYDLMLKVLKQEPLIREALVHELLLIPNNQKVLRFPGGTPSRTWEYNEEDMDLWIQFCEDAGVIRQTYVWNIHNSLDSLKGFIALRNAGQEINVVEVGNEEYYHERIQSWPWINNLVNNNNFFAERYYRPKGQEYARRYNHVKSLVGDSARVAACFGSPDAIAHKWWNKGVEDLTHSLQDIVIHNYRKFPDSFFMDRFTEAMEEHCSRYRWWFTELNMDYESGKYYEKRFTQEHKTKLLEYFEWTNTHNNTDLVQIHSLYKNNGYGRFMWRDGELVDNYKNWF